MLRDLLILVLGNRFSLVDAILIGTGAMYIRDGKYKKGIIILLLGGFIAAIIENLLGI